MKDHQAPRFRPLSTGITAQEFNDGKLAKTGTNWNAVRKAVQYDPGLALEGRGVAVLASGDYETAPRVCLGVTKKGTECKARPVGGRDLCQGHLKQLEASDDEV